MKEVGASSDSARCDPTALFNAADPNAAAFERLRDIGAAERSRIDRAIRSRFRRAPLSFVLPIDVGRRTLSVAR